MCTRLGVLRVLVSVGSWSSMPPRRFTVFLMGNVTASLPPRVWPCTPRRLYVSRYVPSHEPLDTSTWDRPRRPHCLSPTGSVYMRPLSWSWQRLSVTLLSQYPPMRARDGRLPPSTFFFTWPWYSACPYSPSQRGHEVPRRSLGMSACLCPALAAPSGLSSAWLHVRRRALFCGRVTLS